MFQYQSVSPVQAAVGENEIDPPHSISSGTSGSAAHELRLKHLVKRYAAVTVVDDVSIDIARGEFLTLLGPSGSGKTTLLMMLAGFVAPSSGTIEVDGRNVIALPPERRNFGVVFQGYALFPHMSVADNVAYPLKVRGLSRSEIAEKTRAALSLVRLEQLAGRFPRQLSGGQQQRVAIARALSFRPDVVLFDEPLGALDRKLRAEVQAEFRLLHKRLGITFVYVTHDQDEALSMSDRIAIMRDGRLVQLGKPLDLYEHPRDRFVANFLGTSNCFCGRVLGSEDGATLVEVGQGNKIRHAGAISRRDGSAWLAVRPEKLRLTDPHEIARGRNSIDGIVSDISYLGAQALLSVDTEALGLVRLTPDAATMPPLDIGSKVTLAWNIDATVLLGDSSAGGNTESESNQG